MVEKSLQLSRSAGSRFHEALTLRVQAQLFAASGDWQAALGSIQDSISILEETESRLEMGRSIFTRGKIQQRGGDSQAAAADWNQALEVFSSLGALSDEKKTREQIQAASEAAG